MRELIQKVRQWGVERKIIYRGEYKQSQRDMMIAQARKTLEEIAELLDAYAKQDIDKLNDAVGDIIVTLIVGVSSEISSSRRTLAYLERSQCVETGYRFMQIYTELCSAVDDLIERLEKGWAGYDYLPIVDAIEQLAGWVNAEYDQAFEMRDYLELAYNEIKDRKGKVVNGQFVKE